MRWMLLALVLGCSGGGVSVPADLATADLAGVSGEGGPCGGNTTHPRVCAPGLVCVSTLPDVGGTCQRGDLGACVGGGCP